MKPSHSNPILHRLREVQEGFMGITRNFRVRYIVALSALATVILITHYVLQYTIQEQDQYGRVIRLSSQQIELTHRIAFFASRMRTSDSEEDFIVAKQQIGRAIHRMESQHQALLQGSAELDIPHIETDYLTLIYFDSSYGLNKATQRFLDRAKSFQKTEFAQRQDRSIDFVYLVNFGPFVLETLQDAAVTEYENVAVEKIEELRRTETIAVSIAFLLILLEVLIIFRPMERRIQNTFKALESQSIELKAEKRNAESAMRAKAAFVSNMSHELRTPLNAILGFSDALLNKVYGGLANPRQREGLEHVHSSATYLLQLVNDILDMSAAEAEKLKLQETTVPAQMVLNEVTKLAAPLAEKGSVDFQSPPWGGDSVLTFLADKRRVVQVCLNIVSNGIKFCAPGGSVIFSELRLPDGRAGFQIRDTGRGMTEEEITVAKTRFGRVQDRHDKATVEGTGLGLPLSIELMAQHGGEIQINSEKGQGTTVTVLFPISRISIQPKDRETDLFAAITA